MTVQRLLPAFAENDRTWLEHADNLYYDRYVYAIMASSPAGAVTEFGSRKMGRLILISLILFMQVSTSQAQDSIEEEIEEFVLSPCFYRIETKIYWRDGYNEQMTLHEFFEQYESVVDLKLIENSIRESTSSLMDAQLSKADRLFVYRQVLNLLCPI